LTHNEWSMKNDYRKLLILFKIKNL
jgi:hypothetical protein